MNQHCCYILFNDTNNKTYNGYTNNPHRRLRQHNGEIKGGAKYTTREAAKSTEWKYLAIIYCEQFDHNLALCFEWMVKYPTRKRPRPKEYQGAKGRLSSLHLLFSYEKFRNLAFTIKVHPTYFDFLTTLSESYDASVKIECMQE